MQTQLQTDLNLDELSSKMDRFEITDDNNSLALPSTKSTRLYSSASIDSGIFLSPHVESLLVGMEGKGHLFVESCMWPTDSADLVLRVDECLFPVHRMVLWENSRLLASILEVITLTSREDFDMITLNGVNAHDMEDILPYLYDEDHHIDELDVLDLLRIAEYFEATKVIKRCEMFLILSDDVHPLDLLKIAKKYNLNSLAQTAIERASRLRKIAQYADFSDLDLNTQNEILLRLVKFYVRKHSNCSRHISEDF